MSILISGKLVTNVAFTAEKKRKNENELTVVLDTDSDYPVQIKKEIAPLEEEMKEMILTDIVTLCEAIVMLIKDVDRLGFMDKQDAIASCIGHIKMANTISSPGIKSIKNGTR